VQCANGEAMPEITRLLEEIGAATSRDELAALASFADEIDGSYDEGEIARVIDALRETRERLNSVP
jgi:hypothetical protein